MVNTPSALRKNHLRICLTAVRPWAYGASVLPVVIGFAIAFHEGFGIYWPWFAAAAGGVLALHTAGNLINDSYDFQSGLDSVPNAASGAVVRELISPKQAITAAGVFIVFGSLCLAYLAIERGMIVLILGLSGVFFAVFYTLPILSLKHTPLGDVTIMLAFGILPAIGGYWVQAGAFSRASFLWSLPLAMHAAAILHANNWRDLENDSRGGARTLAVVLGKSHSGCYYRLLLLTPFFLTAAYVVVGIVLPGWFTVPRLGWLPLLALTTAVTPLNASLKEKHDGGGESIRALDMRTARVQLLFGTLLTAAFFLG